MPETPLLRQRVSSRWHFLVPECSALCRALHRPCAYRTARAVRTRRSEQLGARASDAPAAAPQKAIQKSSRSVIVRGASLVAIATGR